MSGRRLLSSTGKRMLSSSGRLKLENGSGCCCGEGPYGTDCVWRVTVVLDFPSAVQKDLDLYGKMSGDTDVCWPLDRSPPGSQLMLDKDAGGGVVPPPETMTIKPGFGSTTGTKTLTVWYSDASSLPPCTPTVTSVTFSVDDGYQDCAITVNGFTVRSGESLTFNEIAFAGEVADATAFTGGTEYAVVGL